MPCKITYDHQQDKNMARREQPRSITSRIMSAHTLSEISRHDSTSSKAASQPSLSDRLAGWIRHCNSNEVYGQIWKQINRSDLTSLDENNLTEGIKAFGFPPWLFGMKADEVYSVIDALVTGTEQPVDLDRIYHILTTAFGFDIPGDPEATPRAPSRSLPLPSLSLTEYSEGEVYDQILYWLDHSSPRQVYDGILLQFEDQRANAISTQPRDLTLLEEVLAALGLSHRMSGMTAEDVHATMSRKFEHRTFSVSVVLRIMDVLDVECGFGMSRVRAAAMDLTVNHCIRCHHDYREIHNLLGNCPSTAHDVPDQIDSRSTGFYWYNCCWRRSDRQRGSCLAHRHIARTPESMAICSSRGCSH